MFCVKLTFQLCFNLVEMNPFNFPIEFRRLDDGDGTFSTCFQDQGTGFY